MQITLKVSNWNWQDHAPSEKRANEYCESFIDKGSHISISPSASIPIIEIKKNKNSENRFTHLSGAIYEFQGHVRDGFGAPSLENSLYYLYLLIDCGIFIRMSVERDKEKIQNKYLSLALNDHIEGRIELMGMWADPWQCAMVSKISGTVKEIKKANKDFDIYLTIETEDQGNGHIDAHFSRGRGIKILTPWPIEFEY